MEQQLLFSCPSEIPPDKTCLTCRHRERWRCGGSIIQYCGIRKSNRTFNKKLKIKCKRAACRLHDEGKAEF
jgi:hypothetical protein